MATVQNEMIRRRSKTGIQPDQDRNGSSKDKSFLDWDHIDHNLNIADRNIHIGTRDFTMLRFGRTIRWMAKLAGRLVKYVSKVVTFQQI